MSYSLPIHTLAPDPTVYVVDDDPLVVRSLHALLVTHKHRVQTFSSGEEFLAAYRPGSEGCLITDLRMKGMNGLELQAKLAEIRDTLPVIMVTGHADVGTAVCSLEKGALTLIEKPYESDRLLSAVTKGFRLCRIRRRLDAIRNRLATLSRDEQDVLEMMVEGATNKAIALRLNLSMRTVDRRRQQVLEKMEVPTATQLAASLAELLASEAQK